MYIHKIISSYRYNSNIWYCTIKEMDTSKKYAICTTGSRPKPEFDIHICGFQPPKLVFLRTYISQFVVAENKLIILNSYDEPNKHVIINDKYNVCEAHDIIDGMDGGYGKYDFIVEYSETPPDALPSDILDICNKLDQYRELIIDYEKNKKQYMTQDMVPNIDLFKSQFGTYMHKYIYKIIQFQAYN